MASGGTYVQPLDARPIRDELVQLVGWVICEGYYPAVGRSVRLCQSVKHNPEHVETIRQILKPFADEGATITEYPRQTEHGLIIDWYLGAGIGQQIRELAPNKQLTPKFLNRLTEQQALDLVETLIDADGHRGGSDKWAQKDIGRIDGFQHLCAMVGRRTKVAPHSTRDTSVVTAYKVTDVWTENVVFSEVEYHGAVWCPTTPAGTWMARQGGSTFWTGNSPNTVFEVTESDSPVGYTRFRAWSILEHGDDMKTAARAAAQMPGAPRHEPAIEWPDIIASHRERQNGPQDDHNDPEADAEDDTDTDDHQNPLSRWLVDWDTFWRTDHKAADFLCAPILARGRGHALYAKAKTGKSLLVLEMVAAIATGSPFLHQPAGDPKHVLYIDYEMTPDDLAERMSAYGYGEGDDLTHLHYAQLPAIEPLDTPKGGLTVLQAALAVSAELVVIDTTSRSVQGEENAMETFRDFYRHTFMPLKSAGITTLRVDHAGKDADRGQRGSSAKNDDVDLVWELSAKGADELKLKATHRRMGWVPEVVDIRRTDDLPMHVTDTRRHPSRRSIWPARENSQRSSRRQACRSPMGVDASGPSTGSQRQTSS